MFGTNSVTGKKWFQDAPADSLYVTSMFFTLQGEGPFSGMPALFIRLGKCNLTCSFCFAPSTKITMGDSKTKRIDQIQVGDTVMSWSGDSIEPKKVTKIYTSVADKMVKITSTGEPVWCTPEHPFLTSNRGWVNAENLIVGDKIVHWDIADRKRRFNPPFEVENRIPMTQESKNAASVRMQALWEDPEFREKNIARLTGDGNPMKDPATALKSFVNRESQLKSGLEVKVEKICEGLPITFVGSGDLVIQHKVPDFVVNGQKKVIELWADDSLWVKKAPRDKEWMEKRKALFAKEGYDTLFLPLIQSDLKISEHHKLREKVAEFIHNGKIVQKVEFVNPDDGRGWARLFGSKTATRTVHNLEVEDNHTYIANGCVVHNCDTFFDDGEWMTYTEIRHKAFEVIRSYWKDSLPPEWAMPRAARPMKLFNFPNIVLVLTGGEPLLQSNLSAFLAQESPVWKAIQIETNGTIDQLLPDGVTVVCSPKCSEKNGTATKYLAPSDFLLRRADCLKFVMSADTTSPYNVIPEWAHLWKRINPDKEIYCSPMNVYNDFPQKIKLLRAEKGVITMATRSTVDEKINFFEPGLLNMDAIAKNHEYVGQYCMQHGFKMNMQMHLFANLA